jgi:hypothetical protein
MAALQAEADAAGISEGLDRQQVRHLAAADKPLLSAAFVWMIPAASARDWAGSRCPSMRLMRGCLVLVQRTCSLACICV